MAFLTRTALRFVAAMGLMFAGMLPASAQEFEKNILTGGPTGTYIQFGRDISGLLADCGQTLHVQESAGSLENFLGVRKRRATQFGIVQSDVLEYLRTYSADDPAIARAIAGVRIAFPLYNEEIHLLATRDIGSVSDLAGKRVAIGVEDSGTFLTASLVLDLLDVDGVVRRTITPDESMAQLLSGELDAFFYVAGAPTRIFQNDAIDPERFHLVPISDPVLNTVYTPTSIPAGTYPFQSGPIEAVAVKAVLMTYEYDRNRNAYHRASCEAVSDVSHLILTRFSDLKESGHPKWKQVDLGDIPPGWDIGACVNLGLEPTYSMQCGGAASPAPVDDSAANSAYRKRICDEIGC